MMGNSLGQDRLSLLPREGKGGRGTKHKEFKSQDQFLCGNLPTPPSPPQEEERKKKCGYTHPLSLFSALTWAEKRITIPPSAVPNFKNLGRRAEKEGANQKLGHQFLQA